MRNKVENIVFTLGIKLKLWLTENGKEGSWEGTQFKAKADVMAHDYLVAELTAMDPNIPIVSEEDESSLVNPRPNKYWIIDPIDGTASYVGGYSGYVSQVALIENGTPTLSVIYAPALNLLYSAEKGKGVTLNNVPLPLLLKRSSRILIDNYPEPRGVAAKLYKGLSCTDYIESGSLGLKLLRIADGSADMFVKDVFVKDWDLAPAHLVLSELGAEIYNIFGETNDYSGSYDVNGIVCCRTKELSDSTLNWLKDNN